MHKGMTIRRGLMAAAVVAALAGVTAGALAERKPGEVEGKPKSTPSITVNLVAVEQTVFDRSIAATGTVRARDELVIGSDAAGVRLVEVLVDVGSLVREGDLLARGDDAQLRAQASQQQTSLKQAQADHSQAASNLQRAESLADSGVYSEETIQSRRNSAASAAAKVELVQAQLRELEVKLAQTRVLAPASGVISRKMITQGAVVQPGTELFRLIKNGELEWQAELPSHSIASVVPGTSAKVSLDDGRSVDGRVRLIEPTMDASTRNGLVRVTLPRGAPLKAGQYARGEIHLTNVRTLALPESSVMMKDGYAYVYVVGADDIARLNRIQTGARRGGLVEVSDGLGREARVVGTGAGFVKDGDLVRIAPEKTRVAKTPATQKGDRS